MFRRRFDGAGEVADGVVEDDVSAVADGVARGGVGEVTNRDGWKP